MKILIFGDVHGNLPAFEEMLKAEGKCDAYICLGDLVNYGPWSNECVDLTLSLPFCEKIMGNHEEAFMNGFYPGSNALVQSFFEFCFQDFNRLSEIKNFKYQHEEFGYSFKHTINDLTIYPDTKISLDANYVIGHSHHQFVYRNSGFTLYNAGSVGQNRKFINIINYLILNTENLEFQLCSLPYDIQPLISKMKELKYPSQCIEYYLSKEQFA